MAIFFNILEFLIFVKLFLFWLWLWQLKEYHLGRFLAHFETQKVKKFLSSFWWLKYPKFTKKIIVIFLAGVLLAILWLLFFSGLLLIILAPLFSSLLVLLFQIPTVFWRKTIISKAREKREQFSSFARREASYGGSAEAFGEGGKNLLVIGITGSYGKTSTKEFLYAILVEKLGENKVLKTLEHQNSEVGISQCILQELKPEHEIFICEMGAYNRGGIKLLCDIAKPKIGIVTGVNEQHLATFGTMENLLSAEGGEELIESLPRSESKSSLLRGLPENGVAFFNAKNKHCLELYQKTKIKKILYGENVKLAGLENIEGAKAVARELGIMSEEEIEKACQKIGNKFGGIQIKKGINGLNIIDATYSANPDSVIAHLEYLKTWPGRKIIVMPCLIELGSASKEVHQRIGQKIGEVCDLAIITTKDKLREIRDEAIKNGMKSENILFLENPKEIFEKIKSFCKERDIILLESRVPSQLIQQLTINN